MVCGGVCGSAGVHVYPGYMLAYVWQCRCACVSRMHVGVCVAVPVCMCIQDTCWCMCGSASVHVYPGYMLAYVWQCQRACVSRIHVGMQVCDLCPKAPAGMLSVPCPLSCIRWCRLLRQWETPIIQIRSTPGWTCARSPITAPLPRRTIATWSPTRLKGSSQVSAELP